MKKLLIFASILLMLIWMFVACTEKNLGEKTTGENVTVTDPVTDDFTEEPMM